jgi:hypothetical protein
MNTGIGSGNLKVASSGFGVCRSYEESRTMDLLFMHSPRRNAVPGAIA